MGRLSKILALERMVFWGLSRWQLGVILAVAAYVGLAFHVFVVAYEELTLARTFGETYLAYRRSVRRWVPKAHQD